jgi:hypothetical protein
MPGFVQVTASTWLAGTSALATLRLSRKQADLVKFETSRKLGAFVYPCYALSLAGLGHVHIRSTNASSSNSPGAEDFGNNHNQHVSSSEDFP